MSLRRLVTISLAALLVGYGASYAAALIRSEIAQAAHPPQGSFVEAAGRRVHYVELGEGPPIVLIHGAFGSLRDFTFDLAGRLADRYRVIVFDRPGLGYSEPVHAGPFVGQGDSPAEQARILSMAATKLGADRPIVLGHSFGGIVALAWALDHDPAAIVSVAGVAMPWPGDLGWLYQVNGTRLGGGLITPILAGLAPPPLIKRSVAETFDPASMPKGYADHIGPYMPLRLGAFRANTRQVNTLRPHVVEMQKRYGALDLPIEIVHGTADRTVPITIHSRPLAEEVASAALTEIPGAGHMPHHTHPDDIIAAIDRAATRAGLR